MRWQAPASLLPLLAFGLVGLGQPSDPHRASPGQPPAAPRPVAARLTNAAAMRQRLGLTPEYDHVAGLESVKVAVLDYGFDGVGSRPYLPDNAVLVEHYDPEFVRRFNLGDPEYRKPFEPGNRHGRTMAQIVWAMTGARAAGPRFYLLNANGPTMLRRAVRFAIEEKVDVILFSGSFEGGGNGDGRGPVNRIVADALAAGILWVNAAGNYGHCVYNGPVQLGPDNYLRFRDGPDGTALRFRNRLDENTVTVTLTWNDYREEEDAGTDKDLDLYVEDSTRKAVGSSTKRQVSGDRSAGPDESRNPRERVVLTDLPADLDFNYRIRVRARAGRFTADDRIRVLVASSRDTYVNPETKTADDAVTFFDATGNGELFPPADNPLVLTVGESSPTSASGPTADGRVKPDVLLADARAFFSDGEITAGSSDAAAYLAGVAAVLKAAEPRLQPRHLLRLAREGTSPAPSGQSPAPLQHTGPLPGQLSRTERRADAPPPTDRPPPPGLVVVGPLGRVWVFPGLRRRLRSEPSEGAEMPARSGPGASPAPEVLPSPRPVPPGQKTPTPAQGRVWHTPSRARLADLVQHDP
jgi:hypothetical protein